MALSVQAAAGRTPLRAQASWLHEMRARCCAHAWHRMRGVGPLALPCISTLLIVVHMQLNTHRNSHKPRQAVALMPIRARRAAASAGFPAARNSHACFYRQGFRWGRQCDELDRIRRWTRGECDTHFVRSDGVNELRSTTPLVYLRYSRACLPYTTNSAA